MRANADTRMQPYVFVLRDIVVNEKQKLVLKDIHI